MKRWLIAILILVLFLGGLIIVIQLSSGGAGRIVQKVTEKAESAVAQWLDKQLRAVAGEHLQPQLDFQQLEYEYPLTVTLLDVELVDGGVSFVKADSLRITLAEIPSPGKPVVISEMHLNQPQFRFIITESGNLLGFENLLVPASGGQVLEDGGSTRPEDVFAIHQIEMTNAVVSYEKPQYPAMIIDEIHFDLTSVIIEGESAYEVNARVTRDPIFNLDLQSHLNMSSAVWQVDQLSMDLAVTTDQHQLLPPEAQRWANDHELFGQLVLNMTGSFPLNELDQCQCSTKVELANSSLAFGQYRFPVDSLNFDAVLADRTWRISPFTVQALGGELQAEATIGTQDGQPMEVAFDIRNMRIEEVLRHHKTGEVPQYAGRVVMHGSASATIGQWPDSLTGQGDIAVDEGRLIDVPVVGDVTRKLEEITSEENKTDHGTCHWFLQPHEVQMRDIDLVCRASATRGEGEIGFDSQIDFRVNAGPLEKVQSKLGKVGELMGKLTDKLVKYHITGTLQDPDVKVKPMGLGSG